MENANCYSTTNFLLQSHVIVDHHEDKEEENASTTWFDTNVRYYKTQNPRKKRSKLLRFNDHSDSSISIINTTSDPSTSFGVTKPKISKKPPDPNAPKITRPCTECGKKFWSWKALFGHMRCHPERQWRGINPPPNLKSPILESHVIVTNEDHEIAECLLLLSSGQPRTDNVSTNHELLDEGVGEKGVNSATGDVTSFCKFECSSCKKVFGSHQALGGHRATHKNVKGCFANTRNYGECSQQGVLFEDGNMGIMCTQEQGRGSNDNEDVICNESKKMMVFGGHKCSICLRVFSSGQALGGHMRCHWEKLGDETMTTATTTTTIVAESGLTRAVNVNQKVQGNFGNLDLNFPPVTFSVDDQDDSSASCASISGMELDLRLGL